MAYVRQPPPSIEAMLDQFADWMAQHAQAKVTVTIDYRDGSSTTTEVDHRGPKKPKTPNGEVRGASR